MAGLSYEEQREIMHRCADLGYIERIDDTLRLLFYGVDGIDKDETYRLAIEEEELPTFAALMRSGRWGLCRAQCSENIESDTPHTGPNWLSAYTGETIAEHGVKSHGWARGQETWLGHETCWHRLAEAGRRVGMMTLPVTYPAVDVGEDGWMVSGFPATREGEWYTPDDVGEALPHGFEPYHRWTGKERSDRQWERLFEIARAKEGPTKTLCRRFETDVLGFGVSFLDFACHSAWAGWHHSERAHEFFERREEAYRLADELLSTILNWADPDAVIVAGDHGFGLKHHNVNGFYLAWPRRLTEGLPRSLHVTDVYGLILRAGRRET